MRRKDLIKILAFVVIVVLALAVNKLYFKTSFSADNNVNGILEGAINKYVNYSLSNGEKGTIVEYALRTGMEYENEEEFNAIKLSELNINVNQIDGKYPSEVKVIEKSSKVTNGKTEEIEEDYSYDASNGNLVIRTSNENENGEAIYNEKPSESDRDEYIIIAKYDTYTEEKEERELICDVEYKAVLFDEEREIISEGTLGSKVTENVGELTTVSTTREDIYNGYIKSNVINGTTYETEYKEENEIEISNKEAQERLKIEEKNTFEKEGDVYYKSTKILKDGFVDVLGENGKVEIIDQNGNIVSTIDNNSFDENGEVLVEYGEDVNSITIETSKIEKEGIIKVENVKKIKSDVLNVEDRDIVRNLSVVGTFEKEVEIEVESSNEERINVGATLNIDLNLNNNEEENNGVNVNNTEEPEKTTQTVEEESYRNDEEETIEVKNSTTNVEVSLDNTNWTNEKQNEVTFDIYLNSSNVAYNLFNNPTIRIKLPSDIEKVILGDSSIVYSNGLSLEQPYVEQGEDGNTYIVANLTGKESVYTENNLDLRTNIKIPASIILNKDIESRTDKIGVIFTNNYTVDGSAEENTIEEKITIEDFQSNVSNTQENGNIIDKVTEAVEEQAKEEVGAPSQDEINGLEVKVTPVRGNTELKDGDSVYEGEFIKYNIEITNVTDEPIENVRIVGTIPEGVKYGELEADYYKSEGTYKYNYEDITEKEIVIENVKANETVTKYYEVLVEDLAEGETEKGISSVIKTYIEDTEISNYEIKNTVKTSEVKTFLWSALIGDENSWDIGFNLDNPTGEEVAVRIQVPDCFQIDEEGEAILGYKTEYSTEGKYIGTEPINDFSRVIEDNAITIIAHQSGTYKISGNVNGELAEKNGKDGKVELTANATVTVGENEYKTNETRMVHAYKDISVEMTSETEGEEVAYGDTIIYNVAITCNSVNNLQQNENGAVYVNIKDYLPDNVTPGSVTYDYYEQIEEMEEINGQQVLVKKLGEKQTITEDISATSTDEEGNKLPNIDLYTWIPYQETINVKVEAIAGYVYEKTEVENNMVVQNDQAETKTSNIVKHIILPYGYEEGQENPDEPVNPDDPDTPVTPDNPTNPDNPDTPNTPDTPDNPNVPEERYSISGTAWSDANGDGERQEGEPLVDDLAVLLVDLSDSSNVKAQTTTNNGRYTFEGLTVGNYVVVFRYNTDMYILSQYKVSGATEDVNSDAMSQSITLDGQKEEVGLTDQIALSQNISNIDIGLIEKGGYDLKLDKYITGATVTTVNGTRDYTYNDTKLGRVEIRAKELNGAKVDVKYKIVITNEGKSAATVNEIYDNIPEGLSFEAGENSNWSEEDGRLVNRGLANQVINPGESKELTLTLTKTMTEEDAGTFKNTAEIGSAEGSIPRTEDADSTPGNGNPSEDDYSEADLIIGVGTGIGVYISIGAIIAVIAILVFLGIKFKFKINKFGKVGMILLAVAMVGVSKFESMAVDPPETNWEISKVGSLGYSIDANGWRIFPSSTNLYYYEPSATELIDSHTFTGGVTGLVHCNDGSAYIAGGRSRAGCGDGTTYYYNGVTNVTGPTVEYGPFNLPEIELERLNDWIHVRKIGDNYVFGPFESSSNYTKEYEVTVYDKSGALINRGDWQPCDSEGNVVSSIPGNSTFYLTMPASLYEARGISRVRAEQSIERSRMKYETWRGRVKYRYWTTTCNTGYTHQMNLVTTSSVYSLSGGYVDVRYRESVDKQIDEKFIEWTLFNTNIDLYKVDKDEHEKEDDYEVYLEIEGVLEKTDGTYREEFKTTNGYYHFDDLTPGTYILTETINDNYGYEHNVQMTIEVDGEGGTVQIIYMENEKDTGNLKVVKKDRDSGQPMQGVSFKLRGEEGYVIGIDSSGNRISEAEGKVQFYNMEYGSKEEATTFKTDENGIIEVYNIRTGTYTVEEVSVNADDYGYELDPEYIFCNGQQGVTEGEVVVVRRKSYYTTGRPGEQYPGQNGYVEVPGQGDNSDPNNGEFNGITFENRRKWVKLRGKVFEKMLDGKGTVIQGGYAYTEGVDKLVANVTVKLLDSNGNEVPFKTQSALETAGESAVDERRDRGTTINSIDTDSNGYYEMVDVLIDDIDKYYIQFTYNGMSYESIPLLESPDIIDAGYDGTRAIEGAARDEFNREYSEITHSGTTGPVGESRNDAGSKTHDLNYTEGEHTSELEYGSTTMGHDEQRYPINYTYEQYLINANTRDAFQAKGHSGYLVDMQSKEDIRKNEYVYIRENDGEGFDLGIKEREQPDMALVEDIEKVKVTIAGYEHTYNYNQRFENSEYGDGFDVSVKFGDEYGLQSYTQPIYSSDVVYNQNNPESLGIYVRYKIALRNESTNLYTRINEIVSYYDNRYQFESAEYEDGTVIAEHSQGNSSGNYNSEVLRVNQNLSPMEVRYVYITYRVTNDAVYTLLSEEETILDTVAEITSYSTYSDSGFSIHYAGIDKDSRPGSAEPGNKDTYEDDTDSAPDFKLQVKEGRIIKGTVWEDEAVAEMLENAGITSADGKTLRERIGNGIYDPDPNVVENVTVDLISIEGNPNEAGVSDTLGDANLQGEIGTPGSESTIANLYKVETLPTLSGEVVPATVYTDKSGKYEFKGVIPGKYLLRFTYGNNSVIITPDGRKEIKDVDVYKSTIYRGDRPDNEATAASDTDYWYRDETSDAGAQRFSDARDEIGVRENTGEKYDIISSRLNLEDTYYYENTSTEVKAVAEKALTAIEARSRGFEIKVDFDQALNNESTFEEQTTGDGLRYIFDNMDFGIIRRPIQTMEVTKQVAYVKVTLANGQVVIEGDPRKETIDHLRFLQEDENGSGDISIELDSEIMQGAKLEITYDIIADNTNSEIDYSTDRYYIFGIRGDEGDLIAPQVLRMMDYLSNDLAYEEESVINNDPSGKTNEDYGWTNIRNVETQTVKYNGGTIQLPGLKDDRGKGIYWSENVFDELQGFNQVLATDYFEDMKFEARTAKLQVSKILSNSADDLTFYNDIEVNVLKGRRTSKPDDNEKFTVPGDYMPTSDGRRNPGGDDDHRYVLVTEPTGENQNYAIYVILGVSTLIILTAGIIFIKKKVL